MNERILKRTEVLKRANDFYGEKAMEENKLKLMNNDKLKEWYNQYLVGLEETGVIRVID